MSIASKPLISIITPVYNVEKYLSQCIESVINQTFKDWELLLIDDGSTDKSGEICDEYASGDERIRVLHKANSGQADSRNIALGMAKADWIGFVDSDDWIEPQMFSTLYKLVLETGADISVCSHFYDFKDHSKPSSESGELLYLNHDEAMDLIMDDHLMRNFLWDKLFRKEMITELFPKSMYYEDYGTLFKWFMNASLVVYHQIPLYHYRQRASSTDHDADPRKRYHFFLAELERYNYMIDRQLMLNKIDKFKTRLLTYALSITKNIARSSCSRKDVFYYVNQISQEINKIVKLPEADFTGKNGRRLYWLIHSVPFYIFLMRVGQILSFKKKPKSVNFYE